MNVLDLIRCPDCDSEVVVLTDAFGLTHVEVRHDHTCPTLREMESR